LGVHCFFDLEYLSWEEIIRRATSKPASLNRRFGLPNLPTTLARNLRMPFEGMNPHFGMANTPKMFVACLRGLLVQLSNLILTNVFYAR